MAMMQKLKEMKQRWDHSIKAVLRRVSIFRRLNLSFMLLIMTAAIFLTFFSFYKYSAEILISPERGIKDSGHHAGIRRVRPDIL